MEKVDKMKNIMVCIMIFLYANNAYAESSHAVTFENIKKEYKKGKFKTVKMPSGKVFYMKSIFDLPEKQQKKAWDKFVNGAWKDAGSVMKKEVKILKSGTDTLAGKKKNSSSKYSEYIRTDEEIEQLIKASLKRSIQTHKRECKKGVTSYCLQLAGNYYKGVSFKKNYKKARFYFHKACQQNSGMGCLYLAGIYYRGEGVRRSTKKAIKLYDKACNLKEYRACFVLGKIYLYDKRIKRDVEKANIYLTKSCQHNYKDSCRLIVK